MLLFMFLLFHSAVSARVVMVHTEEKPVSTSLLTIVLSPQALVGLNLLLAFVTHLTRISWDCSSLARHWYRILIGMDVNSDLECYDNSLERELLANLLFWLLVSEFDFLSLYFVRFVLFLFFVLHPETTLPIYHLNLGKMLVAFGLRMFFFFLSNVVIFLLLILRQYRSLK